MFDHTVVNKHKLSHQTIDKCRQLINKQKSEDCEYVLQAGAIIMTELLRHQGVNAVSDNGDVNGDPDKHWKEKLAKVIERGI